MRKLRKRTVLFALIIMTAAISALWYWYYQRDLRREPASNAKFVSVDAFDRKEKYMNNGRRTQPPLSDANGNAGTHPPESEIYYEACGILDQKNAERPVKG